MLHIFSNKEMDLQTQSDENSSQLQVDIFSQ
jgi:hypothetical protein